MPPFNQYVLGLSRQTAQGSPANTPEIVTVVRSADVGPNKETAALEETGQGRDAPAPEVARISAGGGFELYARPLILGLLAHGAFGSNASTLRGLVWAASTAKAVGDFVRPTSGANTNLFEAIASTGSTGAAEPAWPPNVGDTVADGGVTWKNLGAVQNRHLATPADDQPFYTAWRHMFGSSANRLVEKFIDCKVSQFQLQGSAGQPAMTLTSNLVGLRFERLTDMPAGGTLDQSLPIKFVDYLIQFAGAANRRISEFNYNLQAAVNTAQTDQLYDSFAEPGGRTLEVSFTEVFQDLATYNRTLYGGPTGTQPSASESYDPVKAVFKAGDGVPRITLDVPRFKYGTAPLTPSANANEIGRIQVTGAADIPIGGGSISTVETYNNRASY
jgi:hypothetical protein